MAYNTSAGSRGFGDIDADAPIDGQQSFTVEQGDAVTVLGFWGVSGYEWTVINHY